MVFSTPVFLFYFLVLTLLGTGEEKKLEKSEKRG